MLGLNHNVNELVDYDVDWPAMFLDERNRISAALGHIAKAIEHYGSTAVPGMRAKPILDVLVGVTPLEDWKTCRAPRGSEAARQLSGRKGTGGASCSDWACAIQ